MTAANTVQGVELRSAFDSTMGVLRKIGRRDLDKPTPCASWDVQDLVNHVVSAARWWAAMVAEDDGLLAPEGEDYAAGDFTAAYEESIRVTLGAFGAEGAAERIVTVPFGDFPGAALQGFAAVDQFTHGWDLAHALGLDTDLAPELATALLAMAEVGVTDDLRGPDTEASFGPRRPAPDGATPADRLAAYLGREV